jgi:hypothetical protein
LVEVETKETQNVNKATTDKQVGSLVPKVGKSVVATNNHMAIIQIHIGKNKIEDVLLDRGFEINIITK